MGQIAVMTSHREKRDRKVAKWKSDIEGINELITRLVAVPLDTVPDKKKQYISNKISTVSINCRDIVRRIQELHMNMTQDTFSSRLSLSIRQLLSVLFPLRHISIRYRQTSIRYAGIGTSQIQFLRKNPFALLNSKRRTKRGTKLGGKKLPLHASMLRRIKLFNVQVYHRKCWQPCGVPKIGTVCFLGWSLLTRS